MSAKATAWAWSCTLPSTTKLILLAYADAADYQDRAALHRIEIEALTGLSETTVRAAVAKLAEDGFITRLSAVVREDPKDGQEVLVPLYRLEVDTEGRA